MALLTDLIERAVNRLLMFGLLSLIAPVLILGVLDNGMTQLRVDSYVREIFVGLIVLAAVAVASLSKRRNAK